MQDPALKEVHRGAGGVAHSEEKEEMEILSVGANLPFLINGDNYSPLGPA